MITEILQDIQSKLKAPKSQYNKFGNYNYRNCEDILEAVKPLLAPHKAAVILYDTIEAIGTRFYVKATATLKAGDEEISVTAYAREEETKKGMDGSQITGSASSYARKYALNGLFAIDDTKDADTPTNNSQKGDSAKSNPAPKKRSNPAPKEQPKSATEGQPQKLLAADIDRLLDLAKSKNVSEAKLLKKYSVNELGDLTSEQYEACYNGLMGM